MRDICVGHCFVRRFIVLRWPGPSRVPDDHASYIYFCKSFRRDFSETVKLRFLYSLRYQGL